LKNSFSLIEVILVILVIGIASLGIITAMQQVLYDIHKPQIIATATFLASAEAERIIGLDFASVDDENTPHPANYSGAYADYSWQVLVDDIDDAAPNLGSDTKMENYKVVEVSVYHDVIDHVSLTFLRTNY